VRARNFPESLWFVKYTIAKENDPEGVAFRHELGPSIPAGTADQNDVPVATD
jgi:hypothetical protein